MKNLVLLLSVLFFNLSAIAQLQQALNGRIVSMPSTIKILADENDFDPTAKRDLAYTLDLKFIRQGSIFPGQKNVWLTYGGGQAGPKYLGQLRENFEFVIETDAGLRRKVLVRVTSGTENFVSVFGSLNNSTGAIDGIAIDASNASFIEIK